MQFHYILLTETFNWMTETFTFITLIIAIKNSIASLFCWQASTTSQTFKLISTIPIFLFIIIFHSEERLRISRSIDANDVRNEPISLLMTKMAQIRIELTSSWLQSQWSSSSLLEQSLKPSHTAERGIQTPFEHGYSLGRQLLFVFSAAITNTSRTD